MIAKVEIVCDSLSEIIVIACKLYRQKLAEVDDMYEVKRLSENLSDVMKLLNAVNALHKVCEWLGDDEVDHAARGKCASHARRAVILAMECLSDAFPEAADEFYDKEEGE